MCGEQHICARLDMQCIGSPPRVRGTAKLSTCSKSGKRITPACAGNRRIHNLESSTSQDHPRVCGEQPFGGRSGGLCQGSPPRVRGTGDTECNFAPRYRITPACAGNSAVLPDGLLPAGDHPRVCGEQQYPGSAQGFFAGSPPRVRGTVDMAQMVLRRKWITPACAGNRPIAWYYLA